MNKDFYVVIEKDEDGYFVGEVPTLKGCYSQLPFISTVLLKQHVYIGLSGHAF
jgi:hypothetical protein